RIHVKRWSPFEGRIGFYRVATAINPDLIARAVMLPRQAKRRCDVVVNRDLDIGKGTDGHDSVFPGPGCGFDPWLVALPLLRDLLLSAKHLFVAVMVALPGVNDEQWNPFSPEF